MSETYALAYRQAIMAIDRQIEDGDRIDVTRYVWGGNRHGDFIEMRFRGETRFW